jgi:DNA replication and repair protein RecF
VELAFQRRGKKRLKIDGVVHTKLQVLYERLRVVLFGPDDVDLIYGPPSIRRRFLDMSIAQLKHRYISLLWEYKKIVAQRNALLREMSEAYNSLGAVGDDDVLQIWDEKLVETGLSINAERAAFLHEISPMAQDLHRRLTNTGDRFDIFYSPSPSLDEYSVDSFANKLRSRRSRELAMGQSMYGPHRDDVGFLLSGDDCKSFASRGQVKSAVLATKLALLELMRSTFDEPPILLLDEIYSDLDRGRLDMLISILGNLGQVIVTTSKLRDVTELDEFQKLFRIDAGSVSEYTV